MGKQNRTKLSVCDFNMCVILTLVLLVFFLSLVLEVNFSKSGTDDLTLVHVWALRLFLKGW